MMYVTIRVRKAPGSAAESSLVPKDLREAAAEAGVAIQPMHPGVLDPELARWFYADVEDPDQATALTDRLQALASIEAAYITPPQGPPDAAPRDGAQ
jgi:hypothetical protein